MGAAKSAFHEASWFGLGAPRNTPAEIIDKMNKGINFALAELIVKARLADLGGTHSLVRRPISAS